MAPGCTARVAIRRCEDAVTEASSLVAQGQEAFFSDFAERMTVQGPGALDDAVSALQQCVAGLASAIALPPARRHPDVVAARDTVMRVLVAGMGHVSPRARRRCTRALSGLVAGHGWDDVGELPVRVATVGESITVEALISETDFKRAGSSLRIELWAPTWVSVAESRSAPHGVPSLHQPVTVVSPVDPPACHRVAISMGSAPRPGFYDWRVVSVDKHGAATPLASAAPDAARRPRLAQGRLVVYHEGARGECGRQLALDEAGVRFSPDNGAIERHGTFADVQTALGGMFDRGETCLYVDGALERDAGWGETAAARRAAAALTMVDAHSAPTAGAASSSSDLDGAITASAAKGALATRALDLASPGDDTDSLADAVPRLAGSPTDVDVGSAKRSQDAHQQGASAGGASEQAGREATPPQSDLVLQSHAEAGASAMDRLLQLRLGSRSLAARPSASPHAVVDRSLPLLMAGGAPALCSLTAEAAARGIRVVLQCDPTVSASRPHRRYARRAPLPGTPAGAPTASALAHCLDRTGMRQPHRGTDGRVDSYADQVLPNFRLSQAWSDVVADVSALAEHCGVGGVRLAEAQSWPLQPPVDTTEMLRADTDGQPHYSARALLEGDVTVPNEEGGYWTDGSGAVARRHRNPMMAFLATSLWERHGDFALYGDCCWGREGPMIASGIIPCSKSLPAALARTQERQLDKTGGVSHLPPRRLPSGAVEAPVAAAHAAFLREAATLPPGAASVVARSLTSGASPYPALLLGRAAWPAVDVLFTAAGSVHLFGDEESGRAYRIDPTGGVAQDAQFLDDERQARKERLRRRQVMREADAAAAALRLSGVHNISGAAAAGAKPPGSPSGLHGGPAADPSGRATIRHSASRFFLAEGHAGVGGVIAPAVPQAQVAVPAGGAAAKAWLEGGRHGGWRDGPSPPATGSSAEHASDFRTTGGSSGQGPSSGAGAGRHQAALAPRSGTAGLGAGLSNSASSAGLAQLGGLHVADSSLPDDLLSGAMDDALGLDGDAAVGLAEPSTSMPVVLPSSAGMSRAASGELAMPPALSGSSGRHATAADDDDADPDMAAAAVAAAAAAAGSASAWAGEPMAAAALTTLPLHDSRSGVNGFLQGTVLAAFPKQEVRVWRAAPAGDDAPDAAAADEACAIVPSDAYPAPVLDPRVSPRLAALQADERAIRQSVGPSLGFDLRRIGDHYRHRSLLRQALPALRSGAFVPLLARHRLGAHGHVLAFARVSEGSVAVVAANFNEHASTFSIDCRSLAAAFGARALAAASAHDALPSKPGALTPELAEAVTTDSFGVLGRSSAVPTSESFPLPGGVWEVRDAFGVGTPDPALATSLLRGSADAAVVAGWLATSPLVAILTSEEAAAAPVMTTLGPNRSLCWVFHRRADSRAVSPPAPPSAAAAAAAAAATGMGAAPTRALSGSRGASPPLAASSSAPVATRDDTRWALASSLLRLQSTLRLKECGVGTAVASPPGTPLGALVAAEESALLGTDVGAGRGSAAADASSPRWIPPWSMLSDAEMRSSARHNTVYATIEAAAVRGVADCAAVQAAGQPASAGAEAAACLIRRGLRVLVSQWGFRVATAADSVSEAAASDPTGAGDDFSSPPPMSAAAAALRARLCRSASAGPAGEGAAGGAAEDPLPPATRLVSDPLPPLASPGAAPTAAAGTGAAGSNAPQVGRAAADGGRVVPAVAAVVCRAALWHAAAALDGGWVNDSVGPRDGGASAVLLAALARVAAGEGSDGAPDCLAPLDAAVTAFARLMANGASLSSVAFATPELGKFSTVGGLGVMVDELTIGVGRLGVPVTVISPFYDKDKKGRPDYLRQDRILFTGRVITVRVGPRVVRLGLHAGLVRGVRLFFLHNADVFPSPYPNLDAEGQTAQLAIFGKAFLQTLCDVAAAEARGEPLFLPGHGPMAEDAPAGCSGPLSNAGLVDAIEAFSGHTRPSCVVTNDWFTGLVPAYARKGHFGRWFDGTDFLHICHNLDPSYEGRIYPGEKGSLEWLHELPRETLIDPTWSTLVVNPTRCALLTSDSWSTVSRSYRADLLTASPLNHILRTAPHPFAHPNGIDIGHRTRQLRALGPKHGIRSHADAKHFIQRKYFGTGADDTRPLFGFVGRVTAQKGVHLILAAVEPILAHTGGRAQFIIGGMASLTDAYGQACADQMYRLARAYPHNVWADPTAFFTDGVAVNLGCDFCLMPSMFEPGGIVQHEFFVAGTPVIAFKTGGLKDSVIEFHADASPPDTAGNGFTFERYELDDFVASIRRALATFHDAAAYERCRHNALGSVMPLSTVSTAWFGELCRMRRSLPVVHPTAEAADQEARQAAAPALRAAGVDPFDDAISVPSAIGAGFGAVADEAGLSRAASTSSIGEEVDSAPAKLAPVTPGASGKAELVIVEARDGTLAGGAVDPSTPDHEVLVPVRIVSGAPGAPANVLAPNKASTVSVCGSWDGWSARTPLSAGPVPGTVAATVDLRAGRYQYKLVIATPGAPDHWVVDPGSVIARDDAGIDNNALSVVVRRRAARKGEAEASAAILQALAGGVAPHMRALLA